MLLAFFCSKGRKCHTVGSTNKWYHDMLWNYSDRQYSYRILIWITNFNWFGNKNSYFKYLKSYENKNTSTIIIILLELNQTANIITLINFDKGWDYKSLPCTTWCVTSSKKINSKRKIALLNNLIILNRFIVYIFCWMAHQRFEY